MIRVPEISYFQLVVLLLCVSFFAVGARMDGRSPLVWGGLSLGAWLGFTHWCMSGVGGGLLSQVLLFVCLGCYGVMRDRGSKKPSDLGR